MMKITGATHGLREVDRVAVGHQLGHLVGSSAEQRPVVCLELRRQVLVTHCVVAHRDPGDSRHPELRVLAQLEHGDVAAPGPPADDGAIGVGDAPGHQVGEAGVDVDQLRPADVADETVTPRSPVPRRTAVVDQADGEPHVDVGGDLGVPPVLVLPVGTAVDPHDHRERAVALRDHEEAVHDVVDAVVEPPRGRTGGRSVPVAPGVRTCSPAWVSTVGGSVPLDSWSHTSPSGRTWAPSIDPSGTSRRWHEPVARSYRYRRSRPCRCG